MLGHSPPPAGASQAPQTGTARRPRGARAASRAFNRWGLKPNGRSARGRGGDAARSLFATPLAVTSPSQHRRNDPVRRFVSVGEGLDVDDDLLAHVDAAFDRA